MDIFEVAEFGRERFASKGIIDCCTGHYRTYSLVVGSGHWWRRAAGGCRLKFLIISHKRIVTNDPICLFRFFYHTIMIVTDPRFHVKKITVTACAVCDGH